MRKRDTTRKKNLPRKSRRMRIRKPDETSLVVDLTHRRIFTNNRYELFRLLNDIFTTLCFLTGSYFFFTSETKTGTIMFIIGNANTLLRAIISIIQRVHMEWIEDEKGTGKDTFYPSNLNQ